MSRNSRDRFDYTAENLEPYTGEPLGSMDQSWTAAVALDWLALDA